MSITLYKYRLLLLLILLMTIFVRSASAQKDLSLGFSMGYTYNVLDAKPGYYYNRQYIPGSGISIAVPIEYSVRRWLSLGFEPSFTSKNYSTERVIGLTVYDKLNYTNYYYQMPVMAKFALGSGEKKINGFMNIGVLLGYWGLSYVDGFASGLNFSAGSRQDYFNEKIEFDSRRDNRFELGGVIGVGLKYAYTKRSYWFIEGRIQYDVTDMQKQYMTSQYPRYNTTFLLQVGVMFSLKYKK